MQFNHFLPIKIRKYECAALIDSGNVWRSAIEEFARRLGIIETKPIQLALQVTTAQKGVTVTMLGETPQPLRISRVIKVNNATYSSTREDQVHGRRTLPSSIAGESYSCHRHHF